MAGTDGVRLIGEVIADGKGKEMSNCLLVLEPNATAYRTTMG